MKVELIEVILEIYINGIKKVHMKTTTMEEDCFSVI